jgi:hypothetical protein
MSIVYSVNLDVFNLWNSACRLEDGKLTEFGMIAKGFGLVTHIDKDDTVNRNYICQFLYEFYARLYPYTENKHLNLILLNEELFIANRHIKRLEDELKALKEINGKPRLPKENEDGE